MKGITNPTLATAVVIAAVTAVLSAQAVRTERVNFGIGASSATLKGTLRGYQVVDYVLTAREGQTISVSLETTSRSAYFNVLPPGELSAIANGELVNNQWSGTLPASGDYRVRVFLVRAAARRGASASYALTVAITGQTDVKEGGTRFDATGTVPCSVGPDPPGSARCSFGVVRLGADKAELHVADPGFDVTFHKDKVRVLRFSGATVTCADPSEKVTFEKKGDDWHVAVNGFLHYVVSNAVIVGG